jgi:lipopolysaccharide cholinephosphotransferase
LLKKIKNKIFPGQNFADPEADNDYIANRPKTVESLILLKKSFEKYGLKFWLDYGTLLGAVRDGAIIPWDHDIDLGMIKNEDKFKTIIKACKELEKKGFEIHYFLDRCMINFRRKDTLPISIHLYEIIGDKAKLNLSIPRNFKGNLYSYFWWIVAAAKYKSRDIQSKVIIDTLSEMNKMAYSLPKLLSKLVIKPQISLFRMLFKSKIDHLKNKIEKWSKKSTQYLEYEYNSEDYLKLDEIEIYGEEFHVPSNIDEHLSRTYGEDWRKPNPDYIDENDNLLLVKSKIKQEQEMGKKIKIEV